MNGHFVFVVSVMSRGILSRGPFVSGAFWFGDVLLKWENRLEIIFGRVATLGLSYIVLERNLVSSNLWVLASEFLS